MRRLISMRARASIRPSRVTSGLKRARISAFTLMPTRIRSNGMSVALLLNRVVSTTIAAVFLPMVGKYGYSSMFFVFAGCTLVYFITAAFFLPETKGKTLEEIEAHFEGANS